MEEAVPLSLTRTCCGSPAVWSDNLWNLLGKACLKNELLDNFHACRCSDSTPLWNSLMWGCTSRFHSMGGVQEILALEKPEGLGNGRSGATWIMGRLLKSIILYKTCLWRLNGGKALTLTLSCGFHAMWSGMGSFKFTLIANIPAKGQPYSLQISLNTWGRGDHSVRRIWSRWLN